MTKIKLHLYGNQKRQLPSKDSSVFVREDFYTALSDAIKQYGMDYIPDIRKRIVLIPREDIITVWEKDYAEMLVNMIYGSGKPAFHEIISKMKILEERFRQ